VAEWGARRHRRAFGTGEVAPRGAPLRLILLALVLLAIASVLSFPSVGAAQPAPAPAGLRAAVLTPDGTDGYVLTSAPDRVGVAAAPGNASGNLRLVFWPGDAPVRVDETSCATWSGATSDLAQQGAALRIQPTVDGGVRALTITKNVFMHSFWIFNVHVWTPGSAMGREIASFDLGPVFRFSERLAVPRPLPWRMCARTRAGRVELKVWRLTEDEPAWGDATHGGSVAIPADAPVAGTAGWYIGHLWPGMSATFSDLQEHPRSVTPDVAVGAATQDLAPAAASEGLR